jgi:hypothetical protein
MGQPAVTAVRIQPAFGGWRAHHPRNAVVLTFRGPRESIRAGWEAEVVSAIFRDRSAVRALPPVAAVISAAGGEGFLGNPRARAVPTATPVRAQTLRSQVRTAAARAGARVLRVTTPTPYGLALEVVLRTNVPAAFLHHRLGRFMNALQPGWASREGEYIKVTDRKGRRVWESGVATRISSAGTWIEPRLAGCIPWEGPPGREIPPCPA